MQEKKLKCITVFDVVQPGKFDKILLFGNFIEQNFILKILELEITLKKRSS